MLCACTTATRKIVFHMVQRMIAQMAACMRAHGVWTGMTLVLQGCLVQGIC